MKLIADLHTHTLMSGHAMATMNEMVSEAQRLNYKVLAITDHAPAMPGGPHSYYYNNLLNQPNILENGFILLLGVEANVLDRQAKLDMEPEQLEQFDWVIASIHRLITGSMSFEATTDMWLKIAENPYVDMIGHSEQKEYRYDYDRLAKAFAQNNKVVELNASSALTRPGNEGNLRELALACKRGGTMVAVNSDAHSTFQMNNKQDVLKMLEEIDFPEEQVVNSSMELLLRELRRHNKAVASTIAHAMHIQTPAAT